VTVQIRLRGASATRIQRGVCQPNEPEPRILPQSPTPRTYTNAPRHFLACAHKKGASRPVDFLLSSQ